MWDKGDGTLANDTLIETAGKAWRSADYFTKKTLYNYSLLDYERINTPLQGRGHNAITQTKSEFINKVNAMTDYIDKNKLPKDFFNTNTQIDNIVLFIIFYYFFMQTKINNKNIIY